MPLPSSGPHSGVRTETPIVMTACLCRRRPGDGRLCLSWLGRAECQDAFPLSKWGLPLSYNLGSFLEQLNPLTLWFLIKITLWLISRKRGVSGVGVGGRVRRVWLQPVTDAPDCQLAKDVLADAAVASLPGPQVRGDGGTGTGNAVGTAGDLTAPKQPRYWSGSRFFLSFFFFSFLLRCLGLS